jgi:hypothetical protein
MSNDRKDYPAAPENQYWFEPMEYPWYTITENSGFYFYERWTDTNDHSRYRQAHHAPEQLWKRSE